ncbi:hypothetical protein Q9295_02455 [Xinfangfangia sp. CPCC 101601]|uniref:Uncharacterized protein n=1 Tax=Pseudogemmobacter lacusdianii TaxID=3069608 RepID=A0ABU0VU22_9RHOB|nr:hypothetical protein [Xinfangfangia sp. CPCC 101601]MDQ2065222.1 hypothetical protein [Xinfangfangia sp. CPCC 101601]
MTNVDPLAGARALAVQHKAEMFIEAGLMLDDAQMFDRFGYTSEGLAEMRERAEVLALDHKDGWFYPALQFNGDGSLIHRLAEYLAFFRLDGPWVVLDKLLAGPDLHGITILQAMQQKRDDVLDLELAQIQGDGFS